MTEIIINAVTNNILEIIIAVLSAVISYYIIPCIKNDLIPWLKDRRLYDTTKKLVQAAEKLAESGVIKKCDKKAKVVELLEKQGIVVNESIEAFIESAVKELDFVAETVYQEIKTK